LDVRHGRGLMVRGEARPDDLGSAEVVTKNSYDLHSQVTPG